MTGDGANERAPPGEGEEAGKTGFQPIGEAAWRALKQVNARRNATKEAAAAPTEDQHREKGASR